MKRREPDLSSESDLTYGCMESNPCSWEKEVFVEKRRPWQQQTSDCGWGIKYETITGVTGVMFYMYFWCFQYICSYLCKALRVLHEMQFINTVITCEIQYNTPPPATFTPLSGSNPKEGSGIIISSVTYTKQQTVCDVLRNASFLVHFHLCAMWNVPLVTSACFFHPLLLSSVNSHVRSFINPRISFLKMGKK